jgi:hypothetical protein
MRPDSGVSPTLDDDLGFAQCVEDLAVEKFVAQARALKLSMKPFSQGLPGLLM